MKKDLLKVSIRQNAIYLPPVEGMGEKKKLTSTTCESELGTIGERVGYAYGRNTT